MESLGRLLLRRFDRFAEAEEAFAAHTELDPLDEWPWIGRGNLLARNLGRYSEAEVAYRRAIAINPKNEWTWINLADLIGPRLGRLDEAEEACHEAVRVAPNYFWPWAALGDRLYVREKYLEAENAYQNALRIDPQFAWQWELLGMVQMDRLGHFSEAEDALGECLKIDPSRDVARHRLIFLVRDVRGDRDAARRLLDGLHDREAAHDLQALQEALFAAHDDNWGFAATAIRRAMELSGERLAAEGQSLWFFASAVLLHLEFGEKLVQLLQEAGADVKFMPWFEAVRAHALGDRRYLVNIPLEARPTAETIFDRIKEVRERLPRRKLGDRGSFTRTGN